MKHRRQEVKPSFRPTAMRLTVVCENTVGRPIQACGEHGYACLLQTSHGSWLFDTGSGQTLLRNLEALGCDPAGIDGVILSHGHADHTGGLLPLLQHIGPRPVHAHPSVFAERCWQGLHEQRAVGCPHSRIELEGNGAAFQLDRRFKELAPSLFYSGEIARSNAVEKGDPHLLGRLPDTGDWGPDAFADDVAMAVDTPPGLVILLGCAHAGLINTVEHFRRKLPMRRIHAIIGGSHLGPASDEQFDATVDYLLRLDFDRLGLSHCTGQIRAAQLHARMPNKVFFASVGTIFNVE